MKQGNQKERRTIEYFPVNGTGTITLRSGKRDVFVHGYIRCWKMWYFIVHQDADDPELITVSEASTGYRLQDEKYYTVEDALYFAIPFIEKKRYLLATRIDRILVAERCNLLKRNINLQTVAMNVLLWQM